MALNFFILKNNEIHNVTGVKLRYFNFKYQKEPKWYDMCNMYIKETKDGVAQWTPAYDFEWVMNDEWDTVCSEDCGGGVIRRKPGTCKRINRTTLEEENVDEYMCIFLNRKNADFDYTKLCNTDIPCTSDKYTWVTGEWSECVLNQRWRNVGCFVSYIGTSGDIYHQVDDSYCASLGEKPNTIENC